MSRRGSRTAWAPVFGLVITLAGAPPAAADHEAPPVDIVVDTFVDTYDGSCGDGDCSLRDAVASAGPSDSVGLPAGFYQLTLTGAGGVGIGDVDIGSDIALIGIGDTGTFVTATMLGDRAFHVASGTTTAFERITIIGGATEGRGGAIAIEPGGDVTVEHATIASSSARNGGAIAATDATLRVRRSTLTGNVATVRGGGISAHGATQLDVVASAIEAGRAGSGAGIWASSDTALSIERSTIARNTADKGGGIASRAGTSRIEHTTVARNTAIAGGALVAYADVVLDGSLLAANRSEQGRPCVGTFRSRGRNVGTRGTASCGLARESDLIVRDAGLGPLAGAGGPTPTVSLRPSSPAIDVGPDCEERDQRGVRRDRRCDAGAYEFRRCLGRIVNVVGTRHDDELSGGRRADGILGQAGDDELQGSIGDDGICGGIGNDIVLGGPGDDRIKGGPGDNRLRGERGDDRLRGGGGRNLLAGGPGRDVCLVIGNDRTRSCEVVRELPDTVIG